VEGAAAALPAWEDGQLAAALGIVFGRVPSALDVPEIVRVAAPGPADDGRPAVLPDLVPAAAAALAQAIRRAGDAPVRELPLRPERLASPLGDAAAPR
jgi:hypothetical protein